MGYSRFSSEDLVISSEPVSTPIWTGNKETLESSSMATGSQKGTLSGEYYMDVYMSSSDASASREVQFAIAYADKEGSGSLLYNSGTLGYTRSRTNYGQYRSLVLGSEESDFYFGSGSSEESKYFYVISIDRARYKEKLTENSLKLVFNATGGGTVTLVDNSQSEPVSYLDSGRVINLIQSGSPTLGSFGYLLPDIGTIIIDGLMLSRSGVYPISGGRFDPSNPGNYSYWEILDHFKSQINSFTLRAQETVTSNYVFVRAKNSEFNYSVNPSNITDTGELRHNVMVNSPESYITTVGLYNDASELLAVAKLSRPLPKNFTKEALLRIKLDY